MFRFASALMFVVVIIAMTTPRSAEAANYYVDASCSVNGDGLGDGCTSAAGGSGAYQDPQSCFAAARAGDTCYIKNGTYITNNRGSDTSVNGGYSVAASGTSNGPIVFRNYPGHRPILANCPLGSTSYASCANPTITAPAREYIIFDGLVIQGGMWLSGNSPAVGAGSRGIVIRNVELRQGWGEIDDGNWSALFLENLTGALIQRNDIHDISVLSGGGQQSSGGCIKMYQNTDAVVEYNTCRTVRIPESQAGGIDDKAQAVRNTHRFNWIEDVSTCIRINNQLDSTGVQVYGNVCIGSVGTERPGVRLITNINGIVIYNNTFYGFAQGLQVMNEGGPVAGARWYNNIVAGATANNIEAYQTALSFSDFNSWRSGARYQYGGVNTTMLSAFSSAMGLDLHSSDADCQFVSAGSDFHLSSGSTCRGAGRVLGLVTGASVDRGAYGIASCVGRNCADGTTAPAAPTNVRIIR
jgi:hypothetical protein